MELQVFSDIISEENLSTVCSDSEFIMGLDSTFWRHKWWIREDDIILRPPKFLIREGIIFRDFRSLESMKIEVHSGNLRHTRININSRDTLCELCNILYPKISLGSDMSKRFDEESCRTTSRVKDSLSLLGIYDIHEELDNMTRCAKLTSISLTSHDREQIFKGIPELF